MGGSGRRGREIVSYKKNRGRDFERNPGTSYRGTVKEANK